MARIRKAKIRFLSFCARGANGFRTLYKSAATGEETAELSISALARVDRFEAANDPANPNLERGYLHAVVWAPNRLDLFGDWADAETVEQMAHDALRDGVQLDISHSEVPVSKHHAWLAESFVNHGDSRFGDVRDDRGARVNCEGAWCVVAKIEGEGLKSKYRSQEWTGISMGGLAWMDGPTVNPSAHSSKSADASAQPEPAAVNTHSSTRGASRMATPQILKKVVTYFTGSDAQPAAKTDPTPATTPVATTGFVATTGTPAPVFQLSQVTDPAVIEKAVAAALAKQSEATAKELSDLKATAARLEAENVELKKASKAPVSSDPIQNAGASVSEADGLTPEQRSQRDLGHAIAKIANDGLFARRGVANAMYA